MSEAVDGLYNDSFIDDLLFGKIPIETLREALLRRQDAIKKPACGSGQSSQFYNTPVHAVALIIILVVSTLACSFPVIVRRFPQLHTPHRFLFLSRHFGTGVLIATAFVHLLPTAFVSLNDPCLPSFWNEGYPAMPGFIAMMSVFTVVGVEMFFAIKGAGHMHGSEYEGLSEREGEESLLPQHDYNGRASIYRRESSGVRSLGQMTKSDADDSNIELDRLSANSEPTATTNGHVQFPTQFSPFMNGTSKSQPPDHDSDDLSLSPSELDGHHVQTINPTKKNPVLQVMLLEAGILFHSVFIGLALSVTTGTPFVVLLIAISFHQTFEGLALGSRIAAITFPEGPKSSKPWLMALAYGATTPVGQAIGLSVHNLYDPEGEVGLLMVGIMNAISSGLLLFAGLVELLAEDFLSEKSYDTMQGWRRVEACAAVVAGGLLMALVGAWA